LLKFWHGRFDLAGIAQGISFFEKSSHELFGRSVDFGLLA